MSPVAYNFISSPQGGEDADDMFPAVGGVVYTKG